MLDDWLENLTSLSSESDVCDFLACGFPYVTSGIDWLCFRNDVFVVVVIVAS